MDRGAWQATVHGIAESDMTDRLILSYFPGKLSQQRRPVRQRWTGPISETWKKTKAHAGWFPKEVLPPRASLGTSNSEPVASFPQHSCYNGATERRQEAGNHLENHLLVHLAKVKKCASFGPAIPPLDANPGEIHAHNTRLYIPRTL